MFQNKPSAATRAVRFVTAVLDLGSARVNTGDLVEAFDAALFLADASCASEQARWHTAADRINIWLAVRCVCGDPEAVTFINDRPHGVARKAA